MFLYKIFDFYNFLAVDVCIFDDTSSNAGIFGKGEDKKQIASIFLNVFVIILFQKIQILFVIFKINHNFFLKYFYYLLIKNIVFIQFTLHDLLEIFSRPKPNAQQFSINLEIYWLLFENFPRSKLKHQQFSENLKIHWLCFQLGHYKGSLAQIEMNDMCSIDLDFALKNLWQKQC